MKKTLYIQIDNNSLPEGCGEDVEVLDCRCINDFCSIAGDALVHDLKDEDGKPLYRLINPVGRLLADFKDVDGTVFEAIIDDWYDILGYLLNKGIQEDYYTIKFPQQYIDWLAQNENSYYELVGLELHKSKGQIKLLSEDIVDDIISILHLRINRYLANMSDKVDYITFSNKHIGNNSLVVRQLKTLFNTYMFLRREHWEQYLQDEYKRNVANLVDFRAFWVDKLKLGVTTRNDIETRHCVSDFYYYEGHPDISLKFNKKEKLSDIYVTNSIPAYFLNKILSILYNMEVNSKNLNYSSMSSYLISKHNFIVSHAPSNVWESNLNGGTYKFQAELRKDEETYSCILGFYYFSKDYNAVSDCINRMGTCTNITISLN